jgi:fumarylacetoacetate (FAA) hydrolase
MKLATLKDGTRDGRLAVVSRNLQQAVDATAIAPTLQAALERWAETEPALQALSRQLNDGSAAGAFAFDPAQAMAPLPRAYQFIDASAFLNHGEIMEKAFNLSVEKVPGVPILVPRQADDFRGPCDDYEFPSEADNGDFEGEIAVITDDVPMGTSAAEAERHIKLFVLFNDVSMRAHLFKELKMGFGFVLAKPATVFAPVAVTPDELGGAWRDGRVHLDLHVHRNGEPFGRPNGGQMDFSFGEILAHVAYNRRLRAGMVLGSGTFSNANYAEVGSACLAEQRAVDVINHGEAKTPWLAFGERLRFEMFDAQGQSIFGAVDHRMVASNTL